MKALEFCVPNPAMLAKHLVALKSQGHSYNLAFVFASVHHQVGEIQAAFEDSGIAMCGCSTAGEVAGAELHEDTVVGLLLELPPAAFSAWSASDEDVFPQAEALGRFALARYAHPQIFVLTGGLMLADGHMIDGGEVIRGINSGAGRVLPVMGGLAADNFRMDGTYVFDNERVATLGLCAIVFDADVVKVESCARSGWQAIGIEQLISSATGNVVHTINHEPALEFFERYLGAMTREWR